MCKDASRAIPSPSVSVRVDICFTFVYRSVWVIVEFAEVSLNKTDKHFSRGAALTVKQPVKPLVLIFLSQASKQDSGVKYHLYLDFSSLV